MNRRVFDSWTLEVSKFHHQNSHCVDLDGIRGSRTAEKAEGQVDSYTSPESTEIVRTALLVVLV